MILYRNGLITLEYSPASDVLLVELPDLTALGYVEMERTLDLIADNVRNYHISKLLLDSTNILLHRIEPAHYKELVRHFLHALAKTHLKRFARVNSSLFPFEHRANVIVSEHLQDLGINIEFKTFTDKPEGFGWLRS